MYVALTRARRRLYLTFAQARLLHGQTRYGMASRFLDELPAEALLPLNRSVAAPGAPVAAAVQVGEAGLRVGQNVRHAKFGAGVIVDFEGRGADARVQIRFGQAGTKWLVLQYANLQT